MKKTQLSTYNRNNTITYAIQCTPMPFCVHCSINILCFTTINKMTATLQGMSPTDPSVIKMQKRQHCVLAKSCQLNTEGHNSSSTSTSVDVIYG